MSDLGRKGSIALVCVVVAITAVKLAIVLAGPDYDGDAYAHAMAGRRMLGEPGNVAIHWVWLPLLHVLYAAATFFGGGLSTLRVFNVLVSSASPLLLAWFLKRYFETSSRASAMGNEADRAAWVDFVPWLSGVLLALDPLGVWLGVTGQTEPLFQLLVLGGCVACERRAFVGGGALFAGAALVRYEAWLLVPALLWISALHVHEGRKDGTARADSAPRSLARRLQIATCAHLLWILPGVALGGWCLFHYRATGEPFQFLRLNREFATGYLAGVGYPWGREPIWPLMIVYYVTVVPVWNMLGPVHVLAIGGARRGFRELPRTFSGVGAAMLFIVTLGFLRGTHLGLPRHAVVIAPFYAALVAVGTHALALRVGLRFPRISAEKCASAFAFGLLAIVLVTRTVPKTIEVWGMTKHAFSEQATAARALREVARPGEAIFCDDGKIEVLSELPPDRFFRWQIPDVAPLHLADSARRNGSALVISTPARSAHMGPGATLWSNGHLVILRFKGTP